MNLKNEAFLRHVDNLTVAQLKEMVKTIGEAELERGSLQQQLTSLETFTKVAPQVKAARQKVISERIAELELIIQRALNTGSQL
jgi:hypothetical protein